MDLKEYWKRVRKLAAQFDPDSAAADAAELEQIDRVHLKTSMHPVRLISLDNEMKGSRGGQVVEARPYLAAERILDGTHRLATAEEYAAHEVAQGITRENIQREESARVTKGTQVTVDPIALAAAIAGIMPAAAKEAV